MQIGLDSFVATLADPVTGVLVDPVVRLRNLLEEVEAADRVGLDVFGIGEHHREEFLDSAPVVLLAAAAARTKRIRLASAVTVLSAADPVRVFQEFATLDLISEGRAEIVAGRGSFTEAYPLFGLDLRDYDSLFDEKLRLLLQIRNQSRVTWSGKHRPPLQNQEIHPRPLQDPLPIWVGVGGSPESVIRAGSLGLPLMIAIIGGQPDRFRPLVDLYRDAGRQSGHAPERLKVGIHALGSFAATTKEARDDYFPGYERMFGQIGKERGWPAIRRSHFDALCGPEGALIIGDAGEGVEKILRYNDVLGGINRITIQMSPGTLPHPKALKAIEILGNEVAPAVREHLKNI
ncbi:MAG: LLM class flavin-dependent oxidoreductase [Chthoniobacterales bacterium]